MKEKVVNYYTNPTSNAGYSSLRKENDTFKNIQCPHSVSKCKGEYCSGDWFKAISET